METSAPSGQSYGGLTLGSDRRKSIRISRDARALNLQRKKTENAPSCWVLRNRRQGIPPRGVAAVSRLIEKRFIEKRFIEKLPAKPRDEPSVSRKPLDLAAVWMPIWAFRESPTAIPTVRPFVQASASLLALSRIVPILAQAWSREHETD